MIELCELRVPEEHAHLLFAADEGKRLGDTVRLVVLRTDDPRFPEVGRLDREIGITAQSPPRYFFAGWNLIHQYMRTEIDIAELFHLMITAVFEPAGETCGTVYDESNTCQHVFSLEKDVGHIYPGLTIGPDTCGAGRVQVSDLVLDLRKAPKTRDIARTIADEWIVSQRLAELLVDAKLTGFAFRPVRHKARFQDDPVCYAKVPSGRELLRQAAEAGLTEQSWAYYVWLNRPERAELVERASMEHAELLGRRAQRRGKPLPVWYQLVVTSRPLRTVAPTRFGEGLFEEQNRYRCPHGHVVGLNLLSEVFVDRSDWDGSDIACTKELVGARRGVLVPAPLLLISPRFRRLLVEHRIKGWKVDVGYLR